MIRILYKPTCSTCRKALTLLKENTTEKIQVQEYMTQTLSEEELRNLIKRLGMKAEQLVRKKEKLYREKFAGQTLTEEQWIKILHQHPELIERPIVIKGRKVILGRPPERVLEIL
jgi:arsenate reductase